MPLDPALGNTNPIIPQLILQLVLILLNALFASAEIAIISTNEIMLAKNAEKGDKKSAKLLKLKKEPTKFLATIQIGITFAGFLGSAFAGENFAVRITAFFENIPNFPVSTSTIHTFSLIIVTVILSFFTLVLGELVPKRLAMQHPEKMAHAYANFVYALSKILRPFVLFLNATTNLVLRIFRIDPDAAQEKVTEEEIRAMVDAGSIGGTIDPEERAMIENVFEFNNKMVSEVMVHRSDVDVLWLDESIEEWGDTFIASTHSVMAVCGSDIDDVVGTISIKSYNMAIKEGVSSLEGIQTYIIKPNFIPEHVTINLAFQNMRHFKTHFIFVSDEHGGISGIVTIHDILEEIVGDFDDDKLESPDIFEVQKNVWKVKGRTAIYEVNETISASLPEGEVDTIGGFIIGRLQTIPESGEIEQMDDIIYEDLCFRIEEMGNRRIEWAIIERIENVLEEEDTETEENSVLNFENKKQIL